MADKKQRVQTVIGKDLSDIIIYGMKSELTALASVNEVDVAYDYSTAKVYVSHLDPAKVDDLVRFLNNHKGFIRTQLAKSVDIYKVPELVFIKDTLYDKGAKIDKIINSWHQDKE